METSKVMSDWIRRAAGRAEPAPAKPEESAPVSVSANAGNGTGAKPPKKLSMNELIRRAAQGW